MYIRFPFAVSGDKTAVPNTTQLDGSVSWEQGFTVDYELEQGVDPDAKNIPRDQTNQILYALSTEIKQYQNHGTPEFITASDNGGTPYSYSEFDRVRYDDGDGYKVYISIIDSNTDLPTDTDSWVQDIPTQTAITALSGDVVATGPGSVSATIQANAVTTSKINNSAVTLAKIQNIAANSILGNNTGSSGIAVEIVLGASTYPGRGASGNIVALPIIFTEKFVSTETAIATGALNFAHGLTGKPEMAWVKMICKIAEQGYSVGDEVNMPGLPNIGGDNPDTQAQIVWDATNITYLSDAITILNKSTRAQFTITNANWRFIAGAVR